MSELDPTEVFRFIQGFFYSRPLPLAEFMALYANFNYTDY